MRIIHRYLGFFLAGIFLVYSISGIVLIFRDTDFLKQEYIIKKTIDPNLMEAEAIGSALSIRDLEVQKTEGDVLYFQNGEYNSTSGAAQYTVKSLPYVLDKMTKLHKAKSSQPLFFLNIFFGLSLMFFVISSMWMFAPKSSIFKKGMYFTATGVILTLLLLFL